MEAAAIKEISRLTLEAMGSSKIHFSPPGHRPAILVNSSIVETEHLLPGRVRFRGTFNTGLPFEFASYVKANSLPGARAYVDPDRVTAVAYINQGDAAEAGHCDWIANLILKPTAGFAALLAISGKQHSQRDLCAWMEDWGNILTPVYNGEPSPLSRAIASIRSITFKAKEESSHVVEDFGARQSGLSQVEASSEAGVLPSLIEARVVPYQGLGSRVIALRLSVITGDKPALVLRIVGLEALQESIAIEFRSEIEGLLDGTVPVSIGRFHP